MVGRYLLLLAAAAVVAVAATGGADVPSGYVVVPGGKYAHRSCVHSVPSGSVIEKTAGRYQVRTPADRVLSIPKCAHALVRRAAPARRRGTHSHGAVAGALPQHGIAWIVDGMQDVPAGINFFGTNFTVPGAPANQGGALIYFWPGLEDQGEDDVLQPVLQFGSGPEGGGNYWVYQSWFVSGDGTVMVGLLQGPIPTGTPVYGSIGLSADKTQYTSTALIASMEAASVLSMAVSETTLQTRAYVTVEVYNLNNVCNQLPPDDSLLFTNIELADSKNKPVTPNFTPEVQNAACSFVAVPSGDQLELQWSTSS